MNLRTAVRELDELEKSYRQQRDSFYDAIADGVARAKAKLEALSIDDKYEERDQAYTRGRQAAFLEMFNTVAMELEFLQDEEKIKTKLAHMLQERHFAIDALRHLCNEFGDNEWPSTLYLPDIIEKHLHRNLTSKYGQND